MDVDDAGLSGLSLRAALMAARTDFRTFDNTAVSGQTHRVRVPEPEFEAMLTRAAEELTLLAEGSLIEEILSDYAVLQDETRAC